MLIKTYYCFEMLLEPIKTSKAKLPLVIANIRPTILSTSALDMQYNIFKTTLQSNVVATMEAPFHVNPLTQLWRILEASYILQHSFLEFFKLAKIAIVQMLGSMENEWTFSFFLS
jgi:hypothetical protein